MTAMTTQPTVDPAAGRGERRYPLLLCDRCFQETGILVPWTRSLDGNRVLLRCCLTCEAEIAPREEDCSDCGVPPGETHGGMCHLFDSAAYEVEE